MHKKTQGRLPFFSCFLYSINKIQKILIFYLHFREICVKICYTVKTYLSNYKKNILEE